MRTQVFISYRREGGLDSARSLHALLKNDYEVFFDMESLRSGKFDEKIEKAILECTDFLLILSDNVFDRFEEEGDWISRELSLALQHGKNLIPVFLPGFTEPKIQNETIQTAMRYNGVRFEENEDFSKKLRSFLKSNQKCVLPIACNAQGYVLTETAVEALKATRRNMTANKDYGVHVVLEFPDALQSAEKTAPALLCGEARKEWTENFSQQLIYRHQQKRPFLETAFEYMLGDLHNLSAAPFSAALKNQQLAKETFFDPDGRKHFYDTVALWVQIIEEMLKEITLPSPNRLTYYRNRRNEFIGIDCVVDRVARGVKGSWYFTSHAAVQELDLENYTTFPLLKPGVLTLKPETLLQFILPDFYYKVGSELYCGHSQELKDILLNPQAEIRFLGNYWYGLS